MTLPRRIQLVKLLRANGLRGVERMREDDLKDALNKLRLVVPAPSSADRPSPSSHALLARAAEPAPPIDDGDDPHALPRFREPKLLIPEAERTFLRLIAVKPRLLFCTWDAARTDRARAGKAQLALSWHDFLGEPPSAEQLLAQEPAAVVDVELSAGGWYLSVPGERLAIAAALLVGGARIAASNVSLTPPARPAPPGPLWLASLPPSLDRRALRHGRLLKGEVPEAALQRTGESDARSVEAEGELPASGAAMRLRWLQSSSSASSASLASSASSASSAPGRKP